MKQRIECEAVIGKSIKQVLQNNYKMSSALIASLKRTPDGIMVNGEKRYVNYILQEGDKLSVTIEEAGSVNIEPVPMNLDILYEDEYLLAVNKPEHMAVHVSHGNVYNTLSNGVLWYLGQDGQEYTFHGVTRLDKDTSGIVIVAKNAYIHDMLSRQLRDKSFYKEYIGLVEGLLEGEGRINAPIARERESIIIRCVREDGDEAVSEYETIEIGEKYSLVRLKPVTGRTHQLRVHMSYIGHPMAGDTMYGGEAVKENRHFLHCGKVSFFHPIKKQKLEICQKEPEYFWEYLYKNKKTIDERI